MLCPISLFYARAYVHSTEDLEKVVKALRTAVEGRYVVSTVKGHHGNPIQIIEVRLEDWEALDALRTLINRLDDVEFTLLLSGVEETRLYVKFDKQQAYRGVLRVSQGDDVIHVEVRGRSLQIGDMKTYLQQLRRR
ncbi:MAG: RNA-binding domain-containing protein [Pyrobaculum sp.]